jgi:hypothetical protein
MASTVPSPLAARTEEELTAKLQRLQSLRSGGEMSEPLRRGQGNCHLSLH